MEKTRKLLSIILCLALTLCLALPALATEGKYTLTIKSKTPNHDYEAYQIFAGDPMVSPTDPTVDTLVNIQWGTGVNDSAALLNALKAISIGEPASTPFAACKTADDVATELAKSTNAELADAFAAVVAQHLADTPTGTATTAATVTNGKYVAAIENLPAGYYLVKEKTFQGDEGVGNAYTKFILEIVKNVEVEAKADAPTLEKKVSNTNGSGYKDAVAASVGSEVYFKITSKVPEMEGYNKYFFIVNDTLSKGLTYNGDVEIKIGDNLLTKDSDYMVTQTPADPVPGNETDLEIVFKNFITKKNLAGQTITITYSATVNEHAEIGTTGNLNTANLTYSNNPNVEYVGDLTNHDKPDPTKDEPTGVTPNDITAVYVTAIQINKVDTSGNVLTGAGFTLTGTGVIKTGVTQFNSFEEDLNGTYYLLKDGVTYTQTEPTEDTKGDYSNPNKKYSPATPTTAWDEMTSDYSVTGEVGSTGVLKFEGLGTGTYTIEETKVPENYNKIDDITVEISCDLPDTITGGDEECTWYYQIVGSENVEDAPNGIIPLDIQNRSGAELPSTGGIGTTIFVYGGIILMVLALGVVAVRTYSRKKNA